MFTGGLEATAGGSTLPTRLSGAAVGGSTAGDDVTIHASDVVRRLRTSRSDDLSRENIARARSAAHWQQRFVTGLVGLDVAAAGAVAATAYATGFGLVDVSASAATLAASIALPVAWVGANALNQAYEPRFVTAGPGLFTRPLRTFAQLAVVLAFAAYVVPELARTAVLLGLVPLLALASAGRAGARLWLSGQRAEGRALAPVLAVGSADAVQQLAATIGADRAAGLQVVGACLPADEAGDPGVRRRLAEAGILVAGDLRAAGLTAENLNARSVAVLAGDLAPDELRRLAWELEAGGADLLVSTGLAEVCAPRVHVDSVAGTPLLRVDNPHFRGPRRVLKGAFDRAAAGFGLLLISPLVLVLALLVRCTSRGPAFFLQTRVGRNGKTFRMVKFRSMYVDAEERLAELREHNETDGLLFKMKNDPRVTPVGRVLRRFSLDELPQLFNILTGSMSLVGPRPPLPSEVALYEEDTKRRLLVKPGLTGLWQVSGRSDLSWEDSVRLDLHYVENWSLALDMVVLLKTAKVVVRATGAY